MAGRPKIPKEALCEKSQKYRRPPDDGPQQAYEIPEPPDWLDDRELKAYQQLGERIQESICCITASDWLVLGMFAHWLIVHQDAVVAHRTAGSTTTTTVGGTKKSGAMLVLEQSTKQVNEYCIRFGLTPSARQDVKNMKTNVDDPLENLLSGDPIPFDPKRAAK